MKLEATLLTQTLLGTTSGSYESSELAKLNAQIYAIDKKLKELEYEMAAQKEVGK